MITSIVADFGYFQIVKDHSELETVFLSKARILDKWVLTIDDEVGNRIGLTAEDLLTIVDYLNKLNQGVI